MEWGYKIAILLVGLLIFLAHGEVHVEKKEKSKTEEDDE